MELKEKLEQELKEILAKGGDIKAKVQQITEESLSKTEGTREEIKKAIESATKSIKNVVATADIEFHDIMEDVKAGMSEGTKNASHKFAEFKDDIEKFVKEKTDDFDLEDLKTKAKTGFFSAIDKFTDIAEDLVEDLKEKNQEWKADLKEFKEKAEDVIDDAKEKAEDVIEDIQGAFTSDKKDTKSNGETKQ